MACRPAGRCLRSAEVLNIRFQLAQQRCVADQPIPAGAGPHLLVEPLAGQPPQAPVALILSPFQVLRLLWTLLEPGPPPFLPAPGCRAPPARPYAAPLDWHPSLLLPRQSGWGQASSLGVAFAATPCSPRAQAFHSKILGLRQRGQPSTIQRTQAEPVSVPTVEELQATPGAAAAPIALPSLPQTVSASSIGGPTTPPAIEAALAHTAPVVVRGSAP